MRLAEAEYRHKRGRLAESSSNQAAARKPQGRREIGPDVISENAKPREETVYRKTLVSGKKFVFKARPNEGQRVVTILRIEDRGMGNLVVYQYPDNEIQADWSGIFRSRVIREAV